mmetsp:Transcript_4244/g.5943  ORF Transcript_4244/g.5943 Transcript_4244/m.5943 type:complete len:227 (-) Transcript_4244:168-848(-)
MEPFQTISLHQTERQRKIILVFLLPPLNTHTKQIRITEPFHLPLPLQINLITVDCQNTEQIIVKTIRIMEAFPLKHISSTPTVLTTNIMASIMVHYQQQQSQMDQMIVTTEVCPPSLKMVCTDQTAQRILSITVLFLPLPHQSHHIQITEQFLTHQESRCQITGPVSERIVFRNVFLETLVQDCESKINNLVRSSCFDCLVVFVQLQIEWDNFHTILCAFQNIPSS